MNKEDIILKIKEQAYDNVNRKFEEEKKTIEEKINNELEVVEEILKYIKNKLIFKKVGDNWNRKYVLVTEEIFFQDYITEPDNSWYKGVKINYNRDNKYGPFIKVNGEYYYDIRYIIRNYEEDFEYFKNRLKDLNDQIKNIEDGVKTLKEKEPAIKKLIEEFQVLDLAEKVGE